MGSLKLRIDEMYAFVAENEDGEGVMGFKTWNNETKDFDVWMPMVGADMARIKSLYPIALTISKRTSKKFKILKFSKREDITKEYVK